MMIADKKDFVFMVLVSFFLVNFEDRADLIFYCFSKG